MGDVYTRTIHSPGKFVLDSVKDAALSAVRIIANRIVDKILPFL